MKQLKVLLVTAIVIMTSLLITSCENTQVSGSVSYGMGYGGGYPMYYGNGYRHSSVVVVRPPRNNRPRPSPRRR